MPRSLSDNNGQKIGVNGSIVRTNIRRFWPGSALMLFVYLIAALFTYINTLEWTRRPNFAELIAAREHGMAGFLLDQAFFITNQGPAASFGIFAALAGGVTAMLCFGYLMNHRTAVMAHSLPLRRETHLLSAAVSGALLLAAPIAAGGLLFFAALGLNGLFAAQYVLYFIFANCATAFLCFGITAFFAMLTGNSIAHGILTIVFVNLPFMVEGILIGYCSRFLFGFLEWEPVTLFINPFYRVVMYFSDVGRRFDAGAVQNFVTPLLFIAIGAAMLLLAVPVYRRRRTESAGDVVASRAVRPILRYGSALGFATLLGLIFSQVYRSGAGRSSVAGELLFSAIGGAFGFYLAEMFIRRTVRVFHRWHGVAGFAIAFSLVFLFIRYDVPGYGAFKLDESKLDVIMIGEQIENRPMSALLGLPIEQYYMTLADLDIDDPDGVLEERRDGARPRPGVPFPREIAEQIITKDEHVIHAGTDEARIALELQRLLADDRRHFSADAATYGYDVYREMHYVRFIARYTDGRTVQRHYSVTTGPITFGDNAATIYGTPADENLMRLLTQMGEIYDDATGRKLVNCARFADYMQLTVNEPGAALLAKTAGTEETAAGSGEETIAADADTLKNEERVAAMAAARNYPESARHATLNRGEWEGLFEAYARDLAELPRIEEGVIFEARDPRYHDEAVAVEIFMPDGYREHVSIAYKHANAVAWLADRGYIDTGD